MKTEGEVKTEKKIETLRKRMASIRKTEGYGKVSQAEAVEVANAIFNMESGGSYGLLEREQK